ncbi:MAG: GNAT family N-acetyltransferase [Planctomycetes bacterium]|nr:GNAT family N-acetyltransferase [Planctomycetota bacterium]
MESLKAEKVTSKNFDVLCRVFEEAGGEAKLCYCIAGWVPEYYKKTAEENKAYKKELIQTNKSGGYIFYFENRPVGWCLCLEESQVPNFQKYDIPSLTSSYVIKCLVINPSIRGKGLTHDLLRLVIDDLKRSGAKHIRSITALPRTIKDTDLCAGPISTYLKLGFELEKVHKDEWPIYRLNLES